MKKLMVLVLLLLVTSNLYAISPSDLIAHYKMNDNAASTDVLSATGSHDGTSAQNTNLIQVDGSYWNPFVPSHGTLLEGFEAVGDWAEGSGTGSVEDDVTNFRYGSQSVKLNAVAGDDAWMTKTVSWDLSTGDGFVLWLYVDDTAKVDNFIIYISSVSNFAKHFRVTLTNLMTGWNYRILVKSDFTNDDSESWDNTMIGVRFRVEPATGVNGSISFDDFRFGMDRQSKVIITFDGQWDGALSKAYPVMDGNGQLGVMYVQTDEVGGTNRMSLANLQTDIDAGYDWLVANGFGDTAKFYAYPGGYWNDYIIAKVKERHPTGRSATTTAQHNGHFDITNFADLQYKLGAEACVKAKATATVTGNIDTAIETGELYILYFHNIVDAYNGDNDYLTADFETISDYIKTKVDDGNLACITFTDYYDELAGNVSKISGALDFEGSSDYIEIADHADFTPALTPFSISVWLYMHDATNFAIVSKGVEGADLEWRFYHTAGNQLIFNVFDESSNGKLGRTIPNMDSYENQWIHLVGTYAGTTSNGGVKIYLNGVQADTGNNWAGGFVFVEDLTGPVWIGRYDTTYANGLIDDVMFFGAELTLPEVQILYNGGAATEIPAELNEQIVPRRHNLSPLSLRRRYEF